MNQARMQSPAILVAILALVAALAGTAIAGPTATVSVSKKKVKKIAKKQAIKQINKLAPALSVASAETANTADTAGSAATAGNAKTVGNRSVKKVFIKIPIGATRTVGTFGPFTIRGTCDGSGDVENLVVSSSVNDSQLLGQGNGDAGPIFDDGMSGLTDKTLNLDADKDEVPDNDRGVSTFSAARSGGFVLNGVLSYNDSSNFNLEETCSMHGEVIFG
jgi:hypothetical protein